jgi:tetratricopeptide (TPR) repeat protein
VKTTLIALGVSLALALVFWFWHASNLADLANIQPKSIEDVLYQVRRSEGILSLYYIYLFLLIFGMALAVPMKWPSSWLGRDLLSVGVVVVVLIVAFSLISVTNLRVIQADIAFKTADLFANANNWQVAIDVYKRARELAPNEDYYYLFLGRAYLEYAKQLDDPVTRERFIAQAAADLRDAQEINPLNTDHTANLARLYSLWATQADDPIKRNERASTSEDFFSWAVSLSPKNARLWDEWASLYLNVLGLPDEAYERLEEALELDPNYDWTYGLLGDYITRYRATDPDISDDERTKALEEAAAYYKQAIDLLGGVNSTQKLSYYLALAGIQSQLGQYVDAIQSYETALPLAQNHPSLWQIMEALARLYAQVGEQEIALSYANQALELAPEDQKERLSGLVIQLGGEPE